jgi:hypothetical protein
VKMPPSLAGTISEEEFLADCKARGIDPDTNESKQQAWRATWDNALQAVEGAYEYLVNDGMPAEDARGLLPTNMLTRVHMRVDMKTLLNLAGMRLCTQAQFEWRAVFAELAKAIREYGATWSTEPWQFNLIADSFRPVCFAANRCPMKARSDRHCSIRDQVDEFEAAGIKSDQWEDTEAHDARWTGHHDRFMAIRPEQWLADPTAARVAPGRNVK